MSDKKEPSYLWCAVDRFGNPVFSSLSYDLEVAKFRTMGSVYSPNDWRMFEREGWKIVLMRIEEAETQQKAK